MLTLKTLPTFEDYFDSPFTDRQLELAEIVANLPEPDNSPEAIEAWAKRLTEDIIKGTD